MKRLLFVALIATTAVAQPQPTPQQPPMSHPQAGRPQPAAPARPVPQEQIDAMAKLDYMAGRWVGEGWIDMGSGPVKFRGSETVQTKLDGLALLVEGDFYGRMPGSDAEVPVHRTLGVISYDPKTKKYGFDYWLATGNTGQRELTVTANGWSWEIPTPNATIRYRFSQPKPHEWLEVGERSTDGGATWKQFFEMRLSREL